MTKKEFNKLDVRIRILEKAVIELLEKTHVNIQDHSGMLIEVDEDEEYECKRIGFKTKAERKAERDKLRNKKRKK